MELVLLIVFGVVAGVEAAGIARGSVRQVTERRRRARAARLRVRPFDPGVERRAERRAEQLLRSVVNGDEWEMYRDLGFVAVAEAPADRGTGSRARYGYLIYPHKPIVAYERGTGRLLNEYCLDFLEESEGFAATPLPAADDVLAKWLALRGDESSVIGRANMHLPGRQIDPARARSDLVRLANWERERNRRTRPAASLASTSMGVAVNGGEVRTA